MTNIRLVLLGLLSRHPMHGYELKHIIEDHMGDWTDIKIGSIYFSLSKLAEEGSIEVAEETREGNRPSKTIYRITEKGKKDYFNMLHKLWAADNKTYYSLDIGLFFMTSLPKEDIKKYLLQRMDNMERVLNYLTQHKREHGNSAKIPPQAGAIMDHSLYHMEAEVRWMNNVLENLDSFY